ncbi:hypothetical protein [Phenylobacterium deserti]|uniref:Uncharacterized protein n=1 Tax=Phenylobacterium deserti TaxID=1914756 RepID=A0A328ABS4_9CAUL|nr:hypothetical protein [Phenylobacterium deserti]RAK52101.1 hypothetical protein DJ018_13175 [Phenylobacterium deserti]
MKTVILTSEAFLSPAEKLGARCVQTLTRRKAVVIPHMIAAAVGVLAAALLIGIERAVLS